MRLRFSRLTETGLPLLDEVPPHGVCRIEGYNGIGKSLTVRVLRLCAGEQPFARQQALWDGFRAGIGVVRLEADELAGAERILWEFDGEALPEDLLGDAAEPRDDWFQRLEVDGSPATLDRIRTLLDVRAIGANQGLLETLSLEVVDAADEVRLFERELTTSVRLDGIEGLIGDLRRLLEQISPGRIRDRREAEHRAIAEANAAEEAVAAAEDRLLAIRAVEELRSQLQELNTARPTIEGELEVIERDIADVRQRRDALVEALDELEERNVASEDARVQLRKYATTRKRESTRLENAAEALARAMETAGIASVEEVGTARDACRTEIEHLTGKRTEIDATPVLVRLIDELRPPLDRADVAGAGEEVVVDVAQRAVSVRTLQAALAERRLELTSARHSAAATALDREIDALRARLDALNSIPELVRARDQAARRRDSAEDRAKELAEVIDRADAERLQQLRDARRTVDRNLYQLAARRVVLRARLDTLDEIGDVALLEAELVDRLASLKLSVDELATAGPEAQDRVDEARAVARQADERLREARAALVRDLEELGQVVEALSQDPELRWLRTDGTVPVPRVEQDLDGQLAALEALLVAVAAADQRLDGLRNTVTSARTALTAVADELQGGTPLIGDMHTDALRWAEERAQAWFDESSVRRMLLAEGAQEVSVDLERRFVVWSDATTGQDHRTPLEAFSSGQSVFAYTEAQLLLLDRRRRDVSNRIIVIDEFGAFVARDRLEDLKSTLRSWHERHPNDQILIILPVSQDYDELARAAVGKARRAELEGIAAALDAKGYFTDAFTA